MLVLAIDTATLTLSVALAEVEGASVRILEERFVGPPRTHSDALPAELLSLLAAHGRTFPEVNGLVVGLGPGSFTGLRIGLATAKGLAYGRKIPLAGASSLHAMATVAAQSAPEGARLCACIDARRHQVYAAIYRVENGAARVEVPEAPYAPDALAAQLGQSNTELPLWLFGDGVEAHADVFASIPHRSNGGPRTPSAAGLAHLAAPSLGPYDAASVLALEPTYLRGFDTR